MYEKEIELLKQNNYESSKKFECEFSSVLKDDKFLNYLTTADIDSDELAHVFWHLANIIFSEKQVRAIYKKFSFEFNNIYSYFQLYMYSWRRLFSKQIPKFEITDLEEEGITLLKELFKEGRLEFYKSDPRFKAFIKKNSERHEELRLKKGYDQLNEWMDD